MPPAVRRLAADIARGAGDPSLSAPADREPLEHVTTPSLFACRLYSQALREMWKSGMRGRAELWVAEDLARDAAAQDSGFAMAHLLQAWLMQKQARVPEFRVPRKRFANAVLFAENACFTLQRMATIGGLEWAGAWQMLDRAKMFARYASGLRSFLRIRLSEADCLRMVTDQLAKREQAFVEILRRGIFGDPRSPYRRLFEHAGVRLPEAEQLISRHGIEGALTEFCERGIYLSIEEFKTRKPIRRNGLEFAPEARDFDNPLLRGHYESRTGGSRGTRTRLVVDLDLLDHEAAQTQLFLSTFGLGETTAGMWRELPPGMVGIKNWLRYARLGRRFEKWFAQRKQLARAEDVQFQLFTTASYLLGLWYGRPMPKPTHVPPDGAVHIARWMADKRREGSPVLMDTNASTGARICIAALEEELDIAGSFFRLSAEPYTLAKAQLVEAAGCRAASFYSAAEIGYIGMACANPAHVDEVHLMTDKVAMIQRQKQVGTGGPSVASFLLTTVLQSCPKLMLNVEIGDHGVTGMRDCGCLLERLGFRTHLYDIRSFEKLTGAGTTFFGSELITLVEEILPLRFGGNPIDYQFIEDEEGGLTRVFLAISPRLGSMPEREVVNVVLSRLSTVPGGGLMADVWRDSDMLRVIRREPITTGAMKLLPLHILGGGSESR